METNLSKDKKLMLVYGTLRKNAFRKYNYNRFGPQHYVEELWIHGYQLHSLGSYPAACIGVGNVFCELHQVYQKTLDAITRMEQGAGYEVHTINIGSTKLGAVAASLYAMPWIELVKHTKGRITSGDWNEVVE